MQLVISRAASLTLAQQAFLNTVNLYTHFEGN